jgi:hypothetical protein
LTLSLSGNLNFTLGRAFRGSVELFLRARNAASSATLALAALTAFLLGFGGAFAHGQPGAWSLVSGGNVNNHAGVYGTLGTPAQGNAPGSRRYASSWIDHKGNFWVFGGDGYDADGKENTLNDLWEFKLSALEWVWMGGDEVVPCGNTGCTNYAGVYGTPQTASSHNYPGGRFGATSWTDKSGNLWLFGGTCYDANGVDGWCNDLWMYSTTTNEWTWMSGSSTLTCISGLGGYCGAKISYGAPGQANANNLPPGRMGAVGWTDRKGNLWLFSGETMVEVGVDSYLNDLWMFNLATNEWTWMGGDGAIPCTGSGCDGSSGVYGSLGSPNSKNLPGARWFASGWTDSSGNFWLFGGEGMVAGGGNLLNDLWEYSPTTSEWTWMGGSDSIYTAGGPNGIYGAEWTPAPGNVPGGRQYASSWTDVFGNFWLMGGLGFGASGGEGYLNDLWVYIPTENEWVWFGGSSSVNPIGVFPSSASSSAESGSGAHQELLSETGATLDASNPTVAPGGRAYAQSWIDDSGNLWLFGGQDASGYLNDLWEYTPAAVDTPTFSLTAGTYISAQTVTISDATAGATIYYTTDGTTPTTSSTVYSGSITVSSTETIEAMATASGYTQSAVANATYTIAPQAATPTFSLAAGTYTAAQTVTIGDATTGVTIYYTTDGTTPTSQSTLYSGAISVSANETIQAIAVAAGYTNSAVASAAFIINLPPPSFTVSGTAITVTPGATTGNTSTITVSSTGGFTGTVSLSCAFSTNAATDPATCSIPASITISGTTAQTSTLTVNTTAATTGTCSAANLRHKGVPWYTPGSMVLAWVLLFGIPARRRRWQARLGILALLITLTGGILACGGSGGGVGGCNAVRNPGTTAGSYTIIVTGTSATITQTGTVSLTVQ